MLFYHNLILCLTTLAAIFLSNQEILVLLKIIFVTVHIILVLYSQRNVKLKIPSACLPTSRSVSFAHHIPRCQLCSLHIPLRNHKAQTTQTHSRCHHANESLSFLTEPLYNSLKLELLFVVYHQPGCWCHSTHPKPLGPMGILPNIHTNFYVSWNKIIRPGNDTLSIHLSIQIITKGLCGSDAPLRSGSFEMDRARGKKMTPLVKLLIEKHRY